ncbi:hypothetical protein YB2330_004379 [Saitoella coloradoensis]
MPQAAPTLAPNSAVPTYLAPNGTKMWLLNLGHLECDNGWLLRGANTSTRSNKNGSAGRTELVVIAALIEHPTEGLILWETGCAEDVEVKWPAPVTDVFPLVVYGEEHKLPAAIKATGNDIKDVKHVVIGHLHLDHGGGLEHFKGTDVKIWVHDDELKHAFWAVATKADHGVYLDHYLDLNLNWQTFQTAGPNGSIDLFPGITIHHSPGHTPGLCIMQLNLPNSGTFLLTSDQFHIKENYEDGHPHGWLARDHNAWFGSLQMCRRLERMHNARMVFGHDKAVFDSLKAEAKFFD